MQGSPPWWAARLLDGSGIYGDDGLELRIDACDPIECGARVGLRRVLGVLAIFFDWDTQANAVLRGIRLSEAERDRARCLIVDAERRVIAASDGKGLLSEIYPLEHRKAKLGHYSSPAKVVGFALTPGYETYAGLGWYAVIELPLTS